MTGPAWCWRKRGVGRPHDAHEAEFAVAPQRLAALPLRGRVVTGDALDCQPDLCRQIVQATGDDVLIVKANQPELPWAIATRFADPPPGERFATAVTWDKPGDRVETRRRWASMALAGDLDWPGLRQVVRIERVSVRRGQRFRQVRDAIASLGPAIAPAILLGQVRGHWAMETRLHWVRDVTFGEDASSGRAGAAPQVLASLRNVVLAVLRLAGHRNIAAALRHNAWRPGAALRLLGLAP